MKKTIMRIFAFICVLAISFTFVTLPVIAEGTPWAYPYAYAINDIMAREGIVSTNDTGDFISVNSAEGVYPQGVIYADLVHFENNSEPTVVVLRSSSQRGAVSVDVYNYNPVTDEADHITTLSKGYKIEDGIIREVSLGGNDKLRYIIFSEYRGEAKVSGEYYTLIDGEMYKSVEEPQNVNSYGMATFTNGYLHPEVDVSQYNEYLSRFFSDMKANTADSLPYDSMLDDMSSSEIESLKEVLNKTAGFDVTFDIGDYATMSEYALAVKSHDGEAKLNALTHVYDLGEELYYVRYSTDRAYYNGAILRRTDAVKDGYQILLVRNDFIPLSEKECENAKETYLKNRLLLEKAGADKNENAPIKFDKPLKAPKVISGDLRLPIAFIGGGILLVLFVVLFIIMSRNKED